MKTNSIVVIVSYLIILPPETNKGQTHQELIRGSKMKQGRLGIIFVMKVIVNHMLRLEIAVDEALDKNEMKADHFSRCFLCIFLIRSIMSTLLGQCTSS